MKGKITDAESTKRYSDLPIVLSYYNIIYSTTCFKLDGMVCIPFDQSKRVFNAYETEGKLETLFLSQIFEISNYLTIIISIKMCTY